MSIPADPRPEFSFIHWIAEKAITRPEVLLGIGDDAAVLSAPGKEWVTTVDVLMEGVHFLPGTSLDLVGQKAMGVNLSDLAAMAAEPSSAFIGIVLPKRLTRTDAELLYQGIFKQAATWNVAIAGGDTNSWDGPLVISVTLNGLVDPGKAVRRDGAKPGDWIFVTGTLGGSFPSDHHLNFTPRILEARILNRVVDLHAMLDLSDGLGSDLFHILGRSRVGVVLDGEAIPIHSGVSSELDPMERLRRALGDGEDFELLFTVSPEHGQQLLESNPLTIPLTKIGEITSEKRAWLRLNGSLTELNRSGWSHSFGAD